MSDAETVDIDKRYKTVGELLLAAQKRHLGFGTFADGYAFPENAGLDEFVLRITNGLSFYDRVKNTTALTSVDSLLTSHHFGQALMQSVDDYNEKPITILLRQPGDSLRKKGLEPYYSPTSGKLIGERVSYRKMLQTILDIQQKTGVNPFTPLMRKALQIYADGYVPDLNWENVFANPQGNSLELIDQRHLEQKHNHTPHSLWASDVNFIRLQIVSNLLCVDLTYLDESAFHNSIKLYRERLSAEENTEFDRKYTKVIQLLDEATASIKKKHVEGGEPLPPLEFKRIDSTHAIALTDPPSKLVAELKRLHSIVNAPAR
jgi:hypothetical protein